MKTVAELPLSRLTVHVDVDRGRRLYRSGARLVVQATIPDCVAFVIVGPQGRWQSIGVLTNDVAQELAYAIMTAAKTPPS